MIRTATRTLALAGVIGAAAAAPASAMLPPHDPPASKAAPQPVVVEQVQPSGFDFGDAAIGAGVAFALVIAGSGGRLALHRARRPQISPGA